MPDQIQPFEREKPYELAARECFYAILQWRYGDEWTEPRAHLAEEQKLGRLLLDHFKRFDEHLQEIVEHIYRLSQEAARVSLPRPILVVREPGPCAAVLELDGNRGKICCLPYGHEGPHDPMPVHYRFERDPAPGPQPPDPATESPDAPAPDPSPATAAAAEPGATERLEPQS